MFERFLVRGTRGFGPPADLAFREISYSDGDQRLHVGRPNGEVASFESADSATPHTHNYAPTDHSHPEYAQAGHGHGAIVIPLTPINGFVPFINPVWKNELRIYPGLGVACLGWGVRNPSPQDFQAIFAWNPIYSLSAADYFSATGPSSQGGVRNPTNQFAYIVGATLNWTGQSATALDYSVGTAWFPYA